ncbi:MAG: hypothetical protein Tsb0016_02870 [Sphingomonadales bacterium]
MISYRFMDMDMGGNRDGTTGLSPETIATTVPNRFFGAPMQPPTLRVVPLTMTMTMHMIGAMYAPTDRITLMAMGSYVKKTMDHLTFQGPAGTTELGRFRTQSDGFGDTRLSALVGLVERPGHSLHFNAGISLPTGKIGATDQILTPMNMRPTIRLPYAMQIGSGTYDLMPGVTYAGYRGNLAWGAQYLATIRLGDNKADYSLGDLHEFNAWAGYGWTPWLATTLRLKASTQGAIDGRDALIMGPVQTADPDNYGGDRLEAFFGVNLIGIDGALAGHRLAIEAGLPLVEDLNGPQMGRNLQLVVGYQKAF